MPARARASREYSAAHRKHRKTLLPYAYGMVCPKCGQIMFEGQKLQCDHITPIVLGGTDDISNKQMVHAYCNLSAGATLGNQLRGNRASRDW
jgi:hypothetical protein